MVPRVAVSFNLGALPASAGPVNPSGGLPPWELLSDATLNLGPIDSISALVRGTGQGEKSGAPTHAVKDET